MPPELREALESAVNDAENASSSTETTSNEAPSQQTESPSETQPAVSQDTSVGKPDAPKDSPDNAAATVPEKTVGTVPVPEEVKPETAEQRAAHRVDRAPASWKKEAKGEWNALPLHVRQEVHRREQQVNQVMVEASRNREAVDQLNKVVTPYAARLQAMGGVMPAIETLLRAESVLATGSPRDTAAAMAQLIRDYNVDIVALDEILSGAQPQRQQPQQQGPNIAALVQQQVNQALAPLIQHQQQEAQRTKQQAETTVQDMELNPDYPFFDEVREDMADIMEMRAKKGLAISLPEAYNIAVQINPTTASQVKQQTVMQSATQQHQLAQRALNAASSVSGSPASGGNLSNTGDGSLRGAIEAAFGGARL